MNLPKNLKKIILTTAALLFAVSLAAQETSLQTNTQVATVAAEKKFSFLVGFSFSQKVAVAERSERESDLNLLLAPSYKLSERLSLAARSFLSKSNTGLRNTTLANSIVLLQIKGVQLGPQLVTLHSLSAVIPTNQESQKSERLRTSASISNGLSLELALAKIDYRLEFTKNIHEFTQNAEGSPNIEYRLLHAVNLTVPVTEKFSFSSIAFYRQGWTYRGFQRYAFDWYNDLNLDVTANLAVNIGISNGGSALKANGVDSNISAYNPDSTVTRAGFSYSY